MLRRWLIVAIAIIVVGGALVFIVKAKRDRSPVVEPAKELAVNLAVGSQFHLPASQDPTLVKSYDFDEPDDTEGWQLVGPKVGDALSVENGRLHVRKGEGGRARICNLFDLDTAGINRIELCVREPVLTASASWRTDSGEWTPHFDAYSAVKQQGWRVVSIAVGQSLHWRGRLKGLTIRFRPEAGLTQIEVDWIRFLRDENPLFLTRSKRVGYVISGERKWVIPTELPGKFSREVDIPKGATLKFSCGLSNETWRFHQANVKLQVSATTEGGEPQLLASMRLRPKALRGVWQWRKKTVSLADLAGQRATLTFEVSSAAGEPGGLVLWGNPTIEPAITRADKGRTNFIVILVDALRPDHLGAYGYDRATSPNIDQLAKEGIVFENAFAQASCTHLSVASLFTSLFPIESKDEETGYFKIRQGPITLAERLDAAGYVNAAFSANPFVHWDYDFDRGFDTFFFSCTKGWLPAKRLTNKMLKWLENNPHRPFCIYIHYMDAHAPYQSPEEFSQELLPSIYRPTDPALLAGNGNAIRDKIAEGHMFNAKEQEYLKALYDAEIAYTDFNIGRIVERLQSMGIYDNSVIVILADHGEEFWEHGSLEHARTLYDESIRVPLILRLPANAGRQGERVSATVRLVDMYPTILELAGLPPAQGIRGESLLEIDPDEERWEYAEAPAVRALRGEGWKLIDRPKSNRDELYNLQADPAEKKNVISQYPERATKMRAQMNRLTKAKELAPSEEEQRQLLDSKTVERLRALGYIK